MRVLAVRRRVLGNDHADTLDSIHNLGNLKYQQGAQLCFLWAQVGRRIHTRWLTCGFECRC